jgi:hypothetical protein
LAKRRATAKPIPLVPPIIKMDMDNRSPSAVRGGLHIAGA